MMRECNVQGDQFSLAFSVSISLMLSCCVYSVYLFVLHIAYSSLLLLQIFAAMLYLQSTLNQTKKLNCIPKIADIPTILIFVMVQKRFVVLIP